MPDHYEITEDSHITFHTLARGEEEDGFILVGRQDIASYVSIPAEAREIIDMLDSGMIVGEVKKILEKKYGEEVEVCDFIESMAVNEMVKSIDNVEIPTTSPVQKGLFMGITQKHVGWLYSTYAKGVYSAAAVACLVIFAVYPQHVPRPIDYFFHPWYSVAVLFMFFFSWIFVAIHELAHLCAAKSVGVEGTFSLSTRTIFVVAQTNLSNLWAVPRNKRYIVYLAGMAWDTMIILFSLVLILLTDFEMIALPDLWYSFLKAVVFIKVWGVIWQFRFNMQTDIYYVFSNYFRCRNLLGDTKTYIKNFLSRFIKRIEKTDLSDMPEQEMRVLTVYTPFYIGGSLLIVVTFFLRDLPIFLLIVKRAIDGITAGYVTNPAGFIDAVVLIGSTAFNYGLLGYLTLKSRLDSINTKSGLH